MASNTILVIPAKAGIQLNLDAGIEISWTPAFAGVTDKGNLT